MKILIFLLDFFIKSSILVGVSLYCLTQITIISTQIHTDKNYSLTIFFGTIAAYNFLKYKVVVLQNKPFSRLLIYIIITSVIAFFAFLYFYYHCAKSAQIQLFFSGLLVCFYPFIRQFGLIKLFWISFVISCCTVVIPLFSVYQLHTFTLIQFFQRFFLILALLIPFEISDSKTDSFSLQTLPQKFGVYFSKRFGYVCLLLHCIIILIFYQFSFIVFIDFIMCATISILILYSSQKNNYYYASFWVESIPIVWYFSIYLIILKLI